jgi:hypothetical protein
VPTRGSSPDDDAPLGAYGLRLRGVELARELLVAVDPGLPAFELASEVAPAHVAPEYVSERRARLQLRSGGELLIDRDAGSVLARVPHEVRPDELVHPYLAPAAAVIGRWLGRESLHAGAFALDGRVFGLIGTREAGKSSTLAALATRGYGLVCDDMLVLDGTRPLMGPRSVDLRADAAERLGAGEPIGVTGARERWRLRLPPVDGPLELAGWVFLAWGEDVSVRRLGAAERLARLLDERGVRLPPARPEVLVDLAALPAWELRRTHGWDSLDAAVDRLLGLAGA